MTFLNVEYFVETFWNVKTKGVGSVNIFNSTCRMNIIPTDPFTVGKGELEFVAILINILRAENGVECLQFNFADTSKVVFYLLLFVTELLLIGKNLPFASSTLPEVVALWSSPFFGILNKSDHTPLHVVVFFLGYLQVNYISGHAVWHKYNTIVESCECLAFCGYGGYCYIFNKRQILFLHEISSDKALFWCKGIHFFVNMKIISNFAN